MAGRPLIAWPLAALTAALTRVAVVAKADTELPALPSRVDIWREPAEPRHPLTGIVAALEQAGAPVLVCAVDLPLVDAGTVRSLARAHPGEPLVCACASGAPQPLLARYAPSLLPALRRANAQGQARLTDVVAQLGATCLHTDPAVLLNVNEPADLRRAEEALRARSDQPNVNA